MNLDFVGDPDPQYNRFTNYVVLDYMLVISKSPAYQYEVLPPVEDAIKQLHATVNNADTEGYSIVYGVGATNILFMTITAMSRNILNVSSKIKLCRSMHKALCII